MKNRVNRPVDDEWLGYVGLQELETTIAPISRHILGKAGNKIVDAEDLGSLVEQSLAKFSPSGNSWPQLYEVAPDEVYVILDDRILRWDGSSFHALGATKGSAKTSLILTTRTAP